MTNKQQQTQPNDTDPWVDPIVSEVRQVRESIAAEFDYDVSRILAHVIAWGEERRRWMAGSRVTVTQHAVPHLPIYNEGGIQPQYLPHINYICLPKRLTRFFELT